MPIPTPRSLLSDLMTTFPAETAPGPSGTSSTNTLKEAAPGIKNIFLTLHVLYPNELLPALDLLDRRLVTRVQISVASSPGSPDARGDASHGCAGGEMTPVYFVRSARVQNQYQARHHQHSTVTTATRTMGMERLPMSVYEVRTLSWNCSCPAFVFSAFPAHSESEVDDEEDGEQEPFMSLFAELDHMSNFVRHEFGGLSVTRRAVPVCKHLLACVLVEKCNSYFGEFIEERDMSLDEYAGWCAGWGG